jgi:cell wall-associated NlpC family hydrolase
VISAEQLQQIQQQAIEAFPNEAVWLLTEQGIKQVSNVHENPTDFFSVSQKDIAWGYSNGLKAIIHSHPNGVAAPSQADMESQIQTSVPWGLLATDGESATDIVFWGDGAPKAPLIGRGFRHGVTDCYGLIKDYYELEKGIKLPEFPRSWEWWSHNENLFAEGFSHAGFERIDQSQVKPGDVWLAQIRSAVPNHGGILLENELILHQQCSTKPVELTKLSIREPVHRYMQLITHWLRYTGPQQ